MQHPHAYYFLADLVLVLHLAVVAFLVGGLGCVICGNLLGWRWVNRLWLRVAHLSAIAIVVTEAWIGAACPLTTLEVWLRARAGAATYHGSFIAHWVQRILYYDAPPWVFALCYSIFGLLVVAAWALFPPGACRPRPRAGQ